MEWFRLYPVRLLTDIRKHQLTLEEQGFVVQLCTHVALFDGALTLDPESLRAEMRPQMSRKRFDQLWERCADVVQAYLADVTEQVSKHGHVSSVRRGAANARWVADTNGDAKGDASRDANADADKRREEKKRKEPPTPKGELFTHFWGHYPRKTGKGQAEKAFARLKVDEALLERMLTALAWQRRQDAWTKDGGQYVPHPATWLNGRRWEDEPIGGAPRVNGTPALPLPDDFDEELGGTPLPPWTPPTRNGPEGGAR